MVVVFAEIAVATGLAGAAIAVGFPCVDFVEPRSVQGEIGGAGVGDAGEGEKRCGEGEFRKKIFQCWVRGAVQSACRL